MLNFNGKLLQIIAEKNQIMSFLRKLTIENENKKFAEVLFLKGFLKTF